MADPTDGLLGALKIFQESEASCRLASKMTITLVSSVRLHSDNGKFLKGRNQFSHFLVISIQQILLQPMGLSLANLSCERCRRCGENGYGFSLHGACGSLLGHLHKEIDTIWHG